MLKEKENMMQNKVLSPEKQIEQQKDYASRQRKDVGLADDTLFVLGMRDVYYKSEANALADVIDNSAEAGSTFVHIIYNTDEKGKIEEIAILDDGCGIDESFLPHAIRWGASSRHNSRNLYGRYGFGLPTASIKYGTKYSVYSRTDSAKPFNVVTVDISQLGVGEKLELPKVKQDFLPAWIQNYVDSQDSLKGKSISTVVLWSNRDSLVYPNIKASITHVMRHLGIVYHSILLSSCKMYVQGNQVEPIDPLFLTESARHFDINSTRATDHSIPTIKIRDKNGEYHDVNIRISALDHSAYNAEERSVSGRLSKPRKSLREDYMGIFVYRNGRFIDTYKWDKISWQSYARQIGISIDFPAELDEVFGITPQKQTIAMGEEVEQILIKANLLGAYRSLYNRIQTERSQIKAARDAIKLTSDVTVRASELAFAKIDSKRPSKPKSQKSAEEASKNLQRKAKEISAVTGRSEEEERQQLETMLLSHPYKIEAHHGGPTVPFFTPEQIGPQTVVWLNTGHRFYTDVYGMLGEKDVAIRAGIEALLVALARGELSKGDMDRVFYMNERAAWSEDLARALELIPNILSKEDTWEEAIAMDPAQNDFDDLESIRESKEEI
jgi:hypothetical protein